MATTRHPIFTRLRLATESDVPRIHKFVQQLAAHEHVDQKAQATEATLVASLFTAAPPFQSPTVFIIEVSPIPFPSITADGPTFTPIIKTIDLDHPVSDPESENFKSAGKDDGPVAGFVLFYPNYSGFTAKPGFYVYLFVRGCYRGKEMGKMLMAAVAGQAAKMGGRCGRVEWTVLDWNVKAMDFCNGMEADVSEGWKICRLSGDVLRDYA